MRAALQAIRLTLFTAWAPAAYAAGVTFGESLRTISPFAWGVLLALSTLAGITALFNRIVKEPVGVLTRPGVFVVAHMTGSWCAGLIAFFVGVSTGTADGYLGIAIILASFGGAKGVEKLADRYLDVQNRPGPPPLGGKTLT